MAPLIKFIAVLATILIFWVSTGGPARYEATHGVFLRPPSPLDTGEVYGELPEVGDIKLKLPNTLNVFLSGGNAVIGTRGNPSSIDPKEESLELVGRGDAPTNITGWKMTGETGKSAVLGKGAKLPLIGYVNELSNIYLPRGGRALVSSGESPIGVSFRINKCSGYLGQYQEYKPPIKTTCPLPETKDAVSYPIDSFCLDYLMALPRCLAPAAGTIPKALSDACEKYVVERVNYNGCVYEHKSDNDFYTNEWRVFLGSPRQIWGDHDTIKFYDQRGRLIGTYKY